MPAHKDPDTCRYCPTPMPRRTNGYKRICTDCSRRRKFWYTFGITEEEYQELWDKQGGVCAICLQPETSISPQSGRVRRLCVDHNHDTGVIRGLLCYHCNQGLGHFKDDADSLRAAVEYLLRNSGLIVQPRTGRHEAWAGTIPTKKKK